MTESRAHAVVARSVTPTSTIPFALARSWLIRSALSAQPAPGAADCAVTDLEDSVPLEQKPVAREGLEGSRSGGRTGWVRVNDAASGFWAADLAIVRTVSGVEGVILSKTEAAHQVAETRRRLSWASPIIALIETARGIENAADIASARGVVRLAFGSSDYRRDTGASDDPLAMAYPRFRLVVASRFGGLPGPIDGPAITTDVDVLRESCRQAALLGMTGKLHLDPAQSDEINLAFSPSFAELEGAHCILRDQGLHAQDVSYPARVAQAVALISRATQLGIVAPASAGE